ARAPSGREGAGAGGAGGGAGGPPAGRTAAPAAGRGGPRPRLVLEVSPYGSAEVYADDRPTAAVPSPRAAVLGRGVVLSLALDPGRHRLAVRTCPAEGQVGFYALVRGRESAPP